MKKLVIASMDKSAGKTSLIVGMAKVLKNKIGYMKPFGDRLIYRKKRAWDYDSALLTNIFGLKENAEDMTIGFEHSKLRYMYDEAKRKEKLLEMVSKTGKDKDILFVESGRDMAYGTSVHLDATSVTRYIGGRMLVVVSGDDDNIVDKISFLKKYIDTRNADLSGVIINKVHDVKNFKNTYLADIKNRGVNVVGIVPYHEELTYLSVDYLAERLFAKVITGEESLNRVVKNIFIGAMSADAAHQYSGFKKENKLIITSGDRSDMIITALETNAACIVLTNNILPSSNIISMARERNIPLLLVPQDTYHTATQIDTIEPLLTKGDEGKIKTLEQSIRDHVNLKEL